jgi:GNAT superfamily N-acetyltransferase
VTFHVRRLTEDDWQLYRDIRLQALIDAPEAFASTLIREETFTEHDWRARFHTAALFAAFQDEQTIGLVGGAAFTRPSARDLASMWVAPTARGSGVGEALVDAVINWAREDGAHEVLLCYTDGNVRAMRFYEHLGFTPTGDISQDPNDPSKTYVEMRFVL